MTATQKALDLYFEESDAVKAQHELYNEFVEKHGKIVNKFQAYILFNEGWGSPRLKDERGNLGYKMKVRNERKEADHN